MTNASDAIQEIEVLLEQHRRTYHELCRQEAMFSSSERPVRLHNDIADVKQKIAELETDLAEMRTASTDHIASPAPLLSPELQSLLDAIGRGEALPTLTAEQVSQIIAARPITWTEYRLARIAEWAQPRYQFDRRFVQMTLLLDQGEEAQGGRWAAQDARRFSDLQEVLTTLPDSPAFVLLGAPGSGKSTLLRRLQLDQVAGELRAAHELRNDSERMSFLIPLSLYRPQRMGDALSPTPRAWLAERWAAAYPDLPALDDLLCDGKVLLLLDALNEMPHRGAPEYAERIGLWRQFIIEMVGNGRGNRAIFSCRSLDYSFGLSSRDLRVPQVVVQLLSPEQVRQFLEAYIPAEAEATWAGLKDSPQFDLFRTPYFLRLLVDQVAITHCLPQGRAELFTTFVRQVTNREIQADNRFFQVGDLLTESDHRQLTRERWPSACALPEEGLLIPKLSGLAFAMQTQGIGSDGSQVRIEHDAACALIACARSEDILRAGIALAVLDEDEVSGEVLFFHQLLQEYFAARRLAQEPQPELVAAEWQAARVRPSLAETVAATADSDPLPPLPTTGWEETTALAAAMCRDPRAYVRAVMAVNLPLAARCAAAADVSVGDDVKNEVRRALLARMGDAQADLRARIAAGVALGELGDPRFERRAGPHGDYLLPPLVDIPGGDYLIGSEEGLYNNEAPAHVVRLAPFQIGKYPLTNGEYALFLAAGGYEDERWWETKDARAWRRGEGTAEGPKQQWREERKTLQGWLKSDQISAMLRERRITSQQARDWEIIARWSEAEFEVWLDGQFSGGRQTRPRFWDDVGYNNPAQPVVGICWHEARAYCCWLAAQTGIAFRLPNEAEWEAAARGPATRRLSLLRAALRRLPTSGLRAFSPQGRRFAYGDEFDADLCNAFETHIRHTTPVGIFPGGETPEGCVDMTGNVWEWTNTLYRAYPYRGDDGREDAEAEGTRVLRGGAFYLNEGSVRCACRYRLYPYGRNGDGGFRVVASPIGGSARRDSGL